MLPKGALTLRVLRHVELGMNSKESLKVDSISSHQFLVILMEHLQLKNSLSMSVIVDFILSKIRKGPSINDVTPKIGFFYPPPSLYHPMSPLAPLPLEGNVTPGSKHLPFKV